MAIGGAALAGCGVVDDTTREAALALVNADEISDRREIRLLSCSKSFELSEDDDASNAASETCVRDGFIIRLLVAERFVAIVDGSFVSLAVNASPPALQINRHAKAKRFLGTGKESIIVELVLLNKQGKQQRCLRVTKNNIGFVVFRIRSWLITSSALVCRQSPPLRKDEVNPWTAMMAAVIFHHAVFSIVLRKYLPDNIVQNCYCLQLAR